MNDSTTWYILQNPEGLCQILTADQLSAAAPQASQQQWGPFPSEAEAIARRVGLIRSGKCKPV